MSALLPSDSALGGHSWMIAAFWCASVAISSWYTYPLVRYLRAKMMLAAMTTERALEVTKQEYRRRPL